MTDTVAHGTWVPFYEELADRLLTYRDNRRSLIEKVQRVFAAIGMKMPKLDSTPTIPDLDPFTVFGLFNKAITDDKRQRIAAALGREFGVTADPPMVFDGIPTFMPLGSTLYAFMDKEKRGEHDIDNLWSVFQSALALAQHDSQDTRASFIQAYDLAKGQEYVGWKLTIGLFWVRPKRYVNLDGTNRGCFEKSGGVLGEVASMLPKNPRKLEGRTYLDICDRILSAINTGAIPYPDIVSLSDASWEDLVKDRESTAPADSSADTDVQTTEYWLYAPGEGAEKWDDFFARGIMGIGWSKMGDLLAYGSQEDMRKGLQQTYGDDTSQSASARILWQFSREMKPGDVVYAKRGRTEIVGRGVVSGDYENHPEEGRYPNLRTVKWTDRGSWSTEGTFGTLPIKTLTDITDNVTGLERLERLLGDEEDAPAPVSRTSYGKSEFLDEAYMSAESYDRLVGLLRTKRNVILQGPPGVGKTFVAKRLAYSMMGEKDPDRVMLVQFHQSYSYEDFVEGFRPSADGFELTKGAFRTFCERAASDPERDYFFIIDEINRGNLSKIFGELFMLIEGDKRGPKNKLQLLYSRDLFHVPANLYLLGMMNTADRSLALIDYALRRRFAFFPLSPAIDSDGFRAYLEGVGSPALDRLVAEVGRLNEEIAFDESLGDGFRIGHSYFCGIAPGAADAWRLQAIVDYEIVPLLAEYWFDDQAKVRSWEARLRRAIS